MNETSLSLLNRLRRSPESESWTRLIELYSPLIKTWLRKYEVQESDAEDLVQEVLLAVSKHLIKRFDRLEDGSKLQVEDFCQLAEKRLKDKYDGAAELCIRTVRKFATEPLIEVRKLYRLILFSWWMQNGDMHLKNFSLLTTSEGIRRLSPAYDLVCTKLVIPDDTLAMPIGGRNKNFTKHKWLDFADYCEIPERAARRVISEQIDALEPSLRLISASFLPSEMKEQYESIVRENTTVLSI